MGEAHAAWMAPVFFGGSASVAGSAAQQVEIALADIGVRQAGRRAVRPPAATRCSLIVTTLRTELFGEVDEIRCRDVELVRLDAGAPRCPGPYSSGRATYAVFNPAARAALQVAGMGGDEHELVRRHAEQVGAAEVGLRSGL